MRTIISGPVTEADPSDAELLTGLIPTSYVTNGLWHPPVSNLLVEVHPVCPMQPKETAEQARNYTLVHNADALICTHENPHLVDLARSYGLWVYDSTEVV